VTQQLTFAGVPTYLHVVHTIASLPPAELRDARVALTRTQWLALSTELERLTGRPATDTTTLCGFPITFLNH